MARKEITIKDVVELKRENEKLQEIVNFYKMENSEYAFKCNRMENALANIQTITKDNLRKLVETSQIQCNILQMCAGTPMPEPPVSPKEATPEKRTSAKIFQVSDKKRNSNKAHVVKPHMVNGHILYIPTINLTRVSDSHQTQRSAANQSGDTGNSSSDTNQESETGNTPQEYDNDQIEEVSETSPSKSPSHSTVLSGTFQEVKIYLNPVSQEILDENLKKVAAKGAAMKRSRSTSDRRTRSRQS